MTDLLDEASRPRAPKRPGSPTTPVGEHSADFLVAVHEHLRAGLAEVVRVVQSVAGPADAGAARRAVAASALGGTHRALGAFCARFCQVVAVHHAIEDQRMLPDLEAAEPALAPVLRRLEHEHERIHEVLVALDRSLVALATGQAGVEAVHHGVRRLEAVLLSHLAYEEEELLGPIRRSTVVV